MNVDAPRDEARREYYNAATLVRCGGGDGGPVSSHRPRSAAEARKDNRNGPNVTVSLTESLDSSDMQQQPQQQQQHYEGAGDCGQSDSDDGSATDDDEVRLCAGSGRPGRRATEKDREKEINSCVVPKPFDTCGVSWNAFV